MTEGDLKYEMMEKYFSGDISPEEKLAFEKQLSSDSYFASEYKLFSETQALITDKALINFKEQVKDFSKDYHTKQRINKTLGWSGLVVGTVLITGSVFYFNQPESDINNNTINTKELQTTNPLYFKTNAGHQPVNQTSDSAISFNKPMAGISTNHEAGTAKQQAKDTVLKSDVPNKQETTHTENNKNIIPTVVNTNTNQETKVNCDNVDITARVNSKPTCFENASGELHIVHSSIKGGKPPYNTSIEGEEYINDFNYDQLKEGQYTIHIKDAAGCIKTIGTYTITGHYCENQFVFAPFRNETWSIPFHSHTSGNIMIYNKANQMIYNQAVVPGDSWNGTDNAGNQQAGYYRFTIRYENGEVFNGFVTIIE